MDKKRAELALLLERVTQMETEFLSIQSELSAFEFRYHRVIGRRYVEIDLLSARLEECGFRLTHAVRAQPGVSVPQTVESSWARRFARRQDSAVQAKPSESVKRLYREVAKQIHPDLGLDESDRLKRQFLMAEANEAYRSGDGRKLRAILLHWRIRPETVEGTGTGAELVRVIRRVDQVWRRIRVLARKVKALKGSELYRLKTLIEENENHGRDLMRQMASILDEQIARLSEHLAAMGLRHADG